MFKKFGRIAAVTALSLGMALGLGYRAEAMVGGKPVIGISWESADQESDYAPIKKIIEMAGGIPVELGRSKARMFSMIKTVRWTRPVWNRREC